MRRSSLLSLVLILSACSSRGAGTESSAVTVRDSAGITIIVNGGADRPLPWTLTSIAQVGDTGSDFDGFTHVSRWTIATDANDQIHVLDSEAMRVDRFNDRGVPLGSVGGQGGGPGEFTMPAGLAVRDDGTRMVYDYGKQAFLEWGGDDLPRAEHRWGFDGGFGGRFATMGASLVAIAQSGDSLVQRRHLTVVSGPDTTELAVQEMPRPAMQQFTCVGMMLSPLFTPSLRFGVGGGRIAWTTGADYVVTVDHDGRRISVRRAIEPVAPVAADARRLYPDGMTVRFLGGTNGGECTTPAEEVAEKAGLAPRIPVVGDVAVAPGGELWVARQTFEGETPITDVFDPRGYYLGTMTGRGVPLGFLSADRVLFAEEDEVTGLTTIGIFTIDRTGKGLTT